MTSNLLAAFNGGRAFQALDIVASSGDTVTALIDGFSLYNITLAAANDAHLTITTPYVDGKGNYMGQVECLPAAETMADGWYVSQGNTFENRVEVSGEVNLILENGTVLPAASPTPLTTTPSHSRPARTARPTWRWMKAYGPTGCRLRTPTRCPMARTPTPSRRPC